MPEHKKLMAQVRSHETGRGFKGQKRALELLGELVQRGTVEPLVRSTAIALRRDCASRDELCEVKAIFNGVKHGDARVPGLERGFGYVTDPRVMDYFVAPNTNLEMCQIGSCAGDCDDHSMMVAAMLGSLGYMTGLRAWGPRMNEPFVHVYPMVVLPKKAGDISQYTGLGRIDLSGFLAGKELLGLDTTVPESDVGWEPPRGNVLTAWVS